MQTKNDWKEKNQLAQKRPFAVAAPVQMGKMPPHAGELELAILGAILLEKGAFDIASEILPVEAFYTEANQRVYSAMCSAAQKNLPMDILTIVEELRAEGELNLIGGPVYITRLTNGVVSSANIEAHCRIVLQKFIQREIIRISAEAIQEAYEDTTDVFDLLDLVETNVFGLTTNYVKKDYDHISKGLVSVVKRIENLRQIDSSLTGIPSGYKRMDEITHGWQNSDLIILAARPSVGKTAFALNLARNAACNITNPTAVGFFSLEMSASQLINRMLSIESNIWLEKISTGRLGDSQMKTLYKKGVDPLMEAPIYIDDTAGLTIFELRAKARRMTSKHKVGLIIIDYLQLMSGDSKNSRSGNREQEISKISRDLKKLSKQLSVPIIALSQLSREVEKRPKGNRVPQLSDLRESGAIEQDADLVISLYRPPEDEVKEDPLLENTGAAKILKHRNGVLDIISFNVNNNVQRWSEKEADNSTSNLIPISTANRIQASRYEKDRDDDDEETLPF